MEDREGPHSCCAYPAGDRGQREGTLMSSNQGPETGDSLLLHGGWRRPQCSPESSSPGFLGSPWFLSLVLTQ